jgi:Ca2+/H+ antiporter, TMEM165/GDT1 family
VQILATEFGDETFIVAALMAMRHPKLVVFVGAITALIVMTIISTALGFIVPNLISRHTTGLLAGCLYTFFGLRLMYIAYHASSGKEAVEVQRSHFLARLGVLVGWRACVTYKVCMHCKMQC